MQIPSRAPGRSNRDREVLGRIQAAPDFQLRLAGDAARGEITLGVNLILEIGTENEKIAIEIASTGGSRKIRMGDREILCDWIRLADGHYSLIMDGRVFDLLIRLDTETCEVMSRAANYSFRVVDPRRSHLKQAAEDGHAGLQRICANMPGKVIRVMAKKGDSVVHDQGLLMLEAMKMQNEIRAPKSGTVLDIGVKAGMTVNTGDFLLSIE